MRRFWPLKPARDGARLPLWRGLLVLIVVGFGGLALLLRPGERRVAELPAALAEEPDLTLADAVITEYRDDGTPDYQLAAQGVTHFEAPREGGRIGLLDEPRLLLYGRGGGLPWEVQAAGGEVRQATDGAASNSRGEEQLVLRGDVVLRQQRAGGNAEVRTAALTVYPAERKARSEQPVAIVAGGRRARAAGLEADLRSGRMTLFSSTSQRVSIVLEPPTAAPPG